MSTSVSNTHTCLVTMYTKINCQGLWSRDKILFSAYDHQGKPLELRMAHTQAADSAPAC
jgi:hypothetical protein